jgi:flagellar biosynthesis protein
MTRKGKQKPRTKSAVAIAYDKEHDRAPRVVAQGYGELAERIIDAAKLSGVFVHDSPELVGLLMNLDLDETIPEELYQVVAELLVWLSALEQQQTPGNGGYERPPSLGSKRL